MALQSARHYEAGDLFDVGLLLPMKKTWKYIETSIRLLNTGSEKPVPATFTMRQVIDGNGGFAPIARFE